MTREDELLSELGELLPSAASAEAIASHAHELNRLARTGQPDKDPRALLEAGIERLKGKVGRTDDVPRQNYAFVDIATALTRLFGADAAAAGLEVRYLAVANVLGNTTAISGRRVTPRLLRYLARSIIELAESPAARAAETRPDAEPPRAEEFLSNHCPDVHALVALAHERRMFTQADWYAPLLAVMQMMAVGDPSVFGRFAHDTIDFLHTPQLDASDSLALATLILRVTKAAGLPADQFREWRKAITDLLVSPEVSSEVPAALTFIRERAALALAEVGDPRPGVGVANAGGPDHLFTQLSTSPSVYLAIYPVTMAQFSCFSPRHQLVPTLPVVGITLADAEHYCREYEGYLHSEGRLRVRRSDGTLEEEDCNPCTVRLPSRLEFCAAAGGSGITYPWSSVIMDQIGVERRLSYHSLLPVGLFPDEPSSCGAFDLAGLVWQWTSNSWTEKQAMSGTQRTRFQAVYGGGYGRNTRFFENCRFLGAFPETRRNDRGFRIIVQSEA